MAAVFQTCFSSFLDGFRSGPGNLRYGIVAMTTGRLQKSRGTRKLLEIL